MAKNAVTAILTAVATAAALGYLARRALSARAAIGADGQLVLTYPFMLRVPGTIASALIALLALSAPVWAGAESRTPLDIAIIMGVAVGLTSLGVYAVLEFLLVRIEIGNTGILARSPWRRRRFISWQDVESVSFSSGAQWFVIRTRGGKVIRAHLYLSGIRQLYQALKSRVPTQAWKNRYQPFEGL